MNILIAPDSFKGSLTSLEASAKIEAGVRKVFAKASIVCAPIGDGGEGTMDTLVQTLGGRYHEIEVHNPNGQLIVARFGELRNGSVIIEMAESSGLTLIDPDELDVMHATSYGFGELIKNALDIGARDIFLCIGGSATNDGGVGMLQALGVSFRDNFGNEIPFGGGSLNLITSISIDGLDPRISKSRIKVLCDVNNPLIGENGASFVYGPQKGASSEQAVILDENLNRYADIVEEKIHKKIRSHPGSGAAGGVGFALLGFFNAELLIGVEFVMDILEIDKLIKWADLVVTGEGRIDRQSLFGKVIAGVRSRSKKYNKPVIALGGAISDDVEPLYQSGISSIESSVCRPMTLEDACTHAGEYLENASERIMRTINVGIELGKKNVKC